jgi:hypothetical protein
METLPSVNLSALSAILAKSKQVMNVVESNNPTSKGKNEVIKENSYDESIPSYSESDEREPIYENYTPSNTTSARDYTKEQVLASNLPDVVKQAMINNPIPRLSGPPSKFTAEDISKITGVPLKKQPIQQKQPIKESIKENDMVTLSKSQLQSLIDESINRFFKQVYNETVTQETIKKTINLLIKEGKISTKRKI